MPRKAASGVIAGIAACALAGPASAATITVNGLGNQQADNGNCSMVEAITAANTNIASGALAGECAAGQPTPTVDVIAFAFGGAAPHVISPAAALPTVVEAVTIDGSTEPDEVRLDGVAAGIATGLVLNADDVTVDELSVVRFTTAGIELRGSADAVIRDSFIGTDPLGAAGLGNGEGILLGNSVAATTGARIRDNVISGNTTEGVILSENATGTELTGNKIGTNLAGTAAVANGQEGFEAFGASETTIGGDDPGDVNLISGNGTGGVRFVNFAAERATGNAVVGNRIGTRIAGENALPNGGDGVTIGGSVDETEIRDNLISGNTGSGVGIDDASPTPPGSAAPTDTVVAGNLIGTDDDGAQAIGNSQFGIGAFAINDRPLEGTVIGGTTGLTPQGACTGDCNVISANGFGGISVEGDVGISVSGNHVGADVTGGADLGNADQGIVLRDTTGVQVGSAGAGNVISGNTQDGVLIVGNEPGLATGNRLQGNLIGVSSDGATPLGNSQSGVEVTGAASQTLIGGTAVGEPNVIANNADEGVTIAEDATDNAILSNVIIANDDRGIDVGNDTDDVNDPGDADTGANDGQNFPILAFAADLTSVASVAAGTLDSVPDSSFRVEVFTNDTGDSNGRGQGEQLVGAFEVTTDATGIARFAESLGAMEIESDVDLDDVAATATELGPSGAPLSTSEFSPHIETRSCEVPATSGDDTLTGNGAGTDVVCGLGGDDVFTPDGGGDLFVGGEGTDEIDYEAAPGSIEADLAAGFITGPGADGDWVETVENVLGSDFDDIIFGDGLANFVQANDGKDTIEGGEGDDELKGGIGGDTMLGGGGADEVLSQDGGDVLKGQGGSDDELSAGPGKDNLNGGGGGSDHCNGGGNSDDTPAPGCESTTSIP